MFCARRVSARSSTVVSGSVLEVRASDEDRGVRRVDLRVDRRRRQVRWQEVAGRVDRRLDLLLRDVEAQVERELERDDRGAGGARGRHLLQPGHLPELALERGRDRGRHHVRARAGVERLDLDRRVVDLGKRRERQEAVGDDPDDQDRRHEQRRRDRPEDEDSGGTHRGEPAIGLLMQST